MGGELAFTTIIEINIEIKRLQTTQREDSEPRDAGRRPERRIFRQSALASADHSGDRAGTQRGHSEPWDAGRRAERRIFRQFALATAGLTQGLTLGLALGLTLGLTLAHAL